MPLEVPITNLDEDQKFYLRFSICPTCVGSVDFGSWTTRVGEGLIAKCGGCDVLFIGRKIDLLINEAD
jgi:hypothetical protein